jgi:membrane associated rhomboid family serine protease
MFQSIWDDVKREFQHGNMVTRLIILNCIVFIVIVLSKLFLSVPGQGMETYFENFLYFFSMSSQTKHFLSHPWGLLTSAFVHQGLGHIFWNMISFYWFGRIVGDLLGNHRILPIYLLGAIAGNVTYFLMANFTPYGAVIGSFAYGASAAVMAMVAVAAFIAPDYIFNVLLIGPVRLKYVALFVILVDLIAIADKNNTGGAFAHLGGLAFGLLFASQLQKGTDLGKPVSSFITGFQNLFAPKPKKKPFGAFERNAREYAESQSQQKQAKSNRRTSNTEGGTPNEQQARVDEILDKIKQKGYDSLTKEEKDYLFKASKK